MRAQALAPPASGGLHWASGWGVGVAVAGAVVGLVGQSLQPADHTKLDAVARGEWVLVGAVALLYAGATIAGFGATRAWRDWRALALLAVAGVAGVVGIPAAWDGVRVAFVALALLSALGIGLLLLPAGARRGVLGFAVLFHFAGVLTAITSPPATPWITSQLWARVFRTHLNFWYTNNAYQFYSPQPGDATLLYFLIGYDDGRPDEWVKLPRRPEPGGDPLGVEYFRRLSLTEQANQLVSVQNGVPPAVLARRNERPQFATHPEVPLLFQFRAPQDHTRRLLGAYVRHLVADRGGDDSRVRSVRIFRVQHHMLEARNFAKAEDPYDPTTYWPFYFGEYTTDGTLAAPDDPMLYWMLPIFRVPPTPGSPPNTKGTLVNVFKEFAGTPEDPLATDAPGAAP